MQLCRKQRIFYSKLKFTPLSSSASWVGKMRNEMEKGGGGGGEEEEGRRKGGEGKGEGRSVWSENERQG